jgi:hypothetical protein
MNEHYNYLQVAYLIKMESIYKRLLKGPAELSMA